MGGVGIFGIERVGQERLAVSRGKVFLMQGFYIEQDVFEFGDQRIWQNSGAVFVPFSAADDDLAVFKVNVLYPQAQTFVQPQSAAVQQFGHQSGDAAHVGDDFHGFFMRQDSGQPLGAGSVAQVGREGDVLFQDGPIQKEDGAGGLILGGCRDFAFGGKVDDELADFLLSHVFGMPLVMEEDVTLDPVHVRLFGAV